MTSYFSAFKKENDVVELGYTEYKICVIHYGNLRGAKLLTIIIWKMQDLFVQSYEVECRRIL